MNVIQFISAFGLGAIITALVQAWLSFKVELSKRVFQEKKEAYVGFLDALHRSEIEGTLEASLYVGSWNNKIELVGSRAVILACEGIRNTNPTAGTTHPDRPKAMEALKVAMRNDLGIVKSDA